MFKIKEGDKVRLKYISKETLKDWVNDRFFIEGYIKEYNKNEVLTIKKMQSYDNGRGYFLNDEYIGYCVREDFLELIGCDIEEYRNN